MRWRALVRAWAGSFGHRNGDVCGQGRLQDSWSGGWRCSEPERLKRDHFGLDFAALSGQNGTKTAKKGPKLGFSCYLSVTYVFLYAVHSLLLARILSSKK
jgi:hypothetical protein